MPQLSPEVIAALISVVAGAIGAAIILFFNHRARTFQLLESGARADLSLNIDVFPSVLKINESTSILETRIEITNNSRKTCCIPAVYVSARPLVRSGLEGDYLGESDFDKLDKFDKCEKLSEIRNVARVENTFIQLAPDEMASFVRWDTLDKSFVERYPVVVVNVEGVSMSSEFTGEEHFPKFKEGKYRLQWLQFMNEDGGVRHSYIILGRLSESVSSQSLVGRRCLLLPEGGLDVANTEKFRKLLDSMMRWSRHTTVNLLNAPPNNSMDVRAKRRLS